MLDRSVRGWRLGLRGAGLGLLGLGLAVGACVHLEWLDPRDGSPPGPPTPARSARVRTLRADVEHLATTVGERNEGRPEALEEAARWLETRAEGLGYTVERRPYVSRAWSEGGREVRNLTFVLEGTERPREEVVLGAHYDTAFGTPGADDNASGCAVLLALAGDLAGRPLARTVRFVFFVNEEPPAFQTEDMGSLRFAREQHARGTTAVAMLSLESLGYFDDEEDSQVLPFLLGWIYPTTGDYLWLIGDPSSDDALELSTRLLREGPVPVEAAGIPDVVPGVGFSDQWSFWQVGWPGMMLTDTALYRNPHYHEASDTPEKLDYDRLAMVTERLLDVVRALGATEGK